MTENTRDLSKFGFREYGLAGELLTALADNKFYEGNNFLTDGIALEFNPNSGEVFLVDEDCNVAMVNDGKLEQWLVCSDCGFEAFVSDGNIIDGDYGLLCVGCSSNLEREACSSDK